MTSRRRRVSEVFLALLFAAALNADTLLVANRGGNTITLIDPATMAPLGTITVGNDPHEIAVSQDGTRAYVSNHDQAQGTTLSIIDVNARVKIKDVSVAPLVGPHGIVERLGKIWFTAESSRSVGRYDPDADRVDWSAATNQIGTHELVVNSFGTRVYTANVASRSVSVIDVATGVSKTILSVPFTEGIALSPDETEVWAGSASTGGIAIISTQSETVVANLSPGTFAYRLAFTRDGRYVLVPRATENAVVIYDATTRTVARTIPFNGQPVSLVITPDSQTIYVATLNPGQILKVDFATGAILGTLAITGTPDGLALARAPEVVSGKRRRAVRR
jgi:YVTN family beta-propeller protein